MQGEVARARGTYPRTATALNALQAALAAEFPGRRPLLQTRREANASRLIMQVWRLKQRSFEAEVQGHRFASQWWSFAEENADRLPQVIKDRMLSGGVEALIATKPRPGEDPVIVSLAKGTAHRIVVTCLLRLFGAMHLDLALELGAAACVLLAAVADLLVLVSLAKGTAHRIVVTRLRRLFGAMHLDLALELGAAACVSSRPDETNPAESKLGEGDSDQMGYTADSDSSSDGETFEPYG